MRWVRLKRWRRIAVVLSILWMLAVPIFTWKRAEALIRETQSYYYQCVFDPEPDQSRCEDQQSALEDATWRVTKEQTLWGLLPIPLIWLVLWIVVATVRRIRRGFLSQKL